MVPAIHNQIKTTSFVPIHKPRMNRRAGVGGEARELAAPAGLRLHAQQRTYDEKKAAPSSRQAPWRDGRIVCGMRARVVTYIHGYSTHGQTPTQVALEGGDGGGPRRVYLTTKDMEDKEVKCLIAVLRPKHAEQVRSVHSR